jgi:O-antigen/teichoic acid export membrane protein
LNAIAKLISANDRVAAGVRANIYSQAVIIISWLGTVPVFLARWTPDKYGQWLVISAIPVYLTVADGGILTAAANLMTMHSARGETVEMNRVFKSSLLIIAMLVPCVSLLVGVALLTLEFGLSRDQRGAIFAITVCSLLTVSCGLFDAAYRAAGRYPRVTALLATVRLLELLGMILGIYIGGSLTSVGVGFLSGRAIGFVTLRMLARRDVPEVSWKLGGIDWRLSGRLFRTGIGFVAFPFGSLLMLQGMVLLVGAQIGAVAVAVFSSSRTLSRILSQTAGLATRSLAPEISALHGRDRHDAVTALSRRTTRLVMLITFSGALFLVVFGKAILSFWTDRKLIFDGGVYYLLLATAVTTAYWQIRSVRLTATNQHHLLAVMFLLASVGVLVIAHVGMGRFGLVAAAFGALSSEIAMVVGTGYALFRAESRNLPRERRVL